MDAVVAEDVVLRSARSTLQLAVDCLLDFAGRLDDGFRDAVAAIEACQGTVVAVGIGKSRIVAEKFSGAVVSVGVFSSVLCGLEARHGYVGCIRPGDVLVVFSNSGESPELLELAAVAKRKHAPVIAITRSEASTLGGMADHVLALGAHPEAGALAVLPTTSTTGMVAIGDAIAMAIADARGFGLDDLRRTHPGGPIGKL